MIYTALVLAATVSITDVPNPTPNGWVTDMANVISPAAEQSINARLFALKAATGHEVAVVTVVDVNTDTPKSFATKLFNLWGIGSRERNDGLLVLLVTGQRRLEMETGIGMESRLPDDWLQAMQQRSMIPKFKAGDFGGGIEAGIVEVDTKLRSLGPGVGIGTPLTVSGMPLPPGIGIGSPIPMGTAAPTPRDYLVVDPKTGNLVPSMGAPLTQTVAPSGGSGATGLLGLLAGIFGVAGGGAGSIFGALWLGRVMRRCPKCKADTILLDELADDAHLTEAQRMEEQIGSVNYKVYVCPGCEFTRTAAVNRWFSGYSGCKGCGSRTLKSSSTTLTYATYDHGGTVRVDEACVRCPFRNTYTRSTPRKTRPSSSSSSSFGSRSSGGSSFGGGSSRGGGSGSSW